MPGGWGRAAQGWGAVAAGANGAAWRWAGGSVGVDGGPGCGVETGVPAAGRVTGRRPGRLTSVAVIEAAQTLPVTAGRWLADAACDAFVEFD